MAWPLISVPTPESEFVANGSSSLELPQPSISKKTIKDKAFGVLVFKERFFKVQVFEVLLSEVLLIVVQSE